MKIARPATKKARIEIIPMIDVIFFLLVFFMFSSFSMLRMKGLGLSVPTGGSAGAGAAKASQTPKIVVTRTPRGETYIGRNRATSAPLTQQLEAAAARAPGAPVILNFAKNQSTQSLVDVLDAAGRAKAPNGQPLTVLVASEAIDADGNAIR